MPDPTHITVTAPEGRRTPIHPSDGSEPGGAQLHVVSGVVARVRYSQDVRRSIARGDLVPCDMNGATVGVALAASTDEIPLGKIAVAATVEDFVDGINRATEAATQANRMPRDPRVVEHIPDPKKGNPR